MAFLIGQTRDTVSLRARVLPARAGPVSRRVVAAESGPSMCDKRVWAACFGEETDDLRFIRSRFADRLHAPDIRAADAEGATYTHVAAQANQPDILRALLDAGADARRRRNDGATPLFVAAQEGAAACVRLLLYVTSNDAAHNDEDEDGVTPLYAAAAHGHLDVVMFLLGRGAPADRAMRDGATPLFIACQNGHEAVARALLARAAKPDVTRAPWGQTPLFNAVMNGHPDLVRLLVSRRAGRAARVNVACAGDGDGLLRGCTPLHACNSGFAARCARGAWKWRERMIRPHLRGVERRHRFEESALALLRAGADPRLRDACGWTVDAGLRASHDPEGRELGELLRAVRLVGSYDSWGAQCPKHPFVFRHVTRWQIGALLRRAQPGDDEEPAASLGSQVHVRFPGRMDEAAFVRIAAFSGVA